jgi:hypothetical protein
MEESMSKRRGAADLFDGAITIGRGVGTRALTDQRWSNFCLTTVKLASSYARAIYVRNKGHGPWNGGTEENFVLIFGGCAKRNYPVLCFLLGRLAHDFDQEAISLLPGTSELITPLTPAIEWKGGHAS